MVMGELERKTEVLVIGSGPAGYAAAFRAADLGLDVTMVDPAPKPGGVCLHEGCIPSKTLLFVAELLHDAERATAMGVHFAPPRVDLEMLRNWKQQVVDTMAEGLAALCRRRGVELIHGRARFTGSDAVWLEEAEIRRIRFDRAIIATGSRPLSLPGTRFAPESRIMNSAGALALDEIPSSLLVVGGGYVGLELGMVYAALGSRVLLFEREEQLLTGVDRDLVEPLQRRLERVFAEIRLGTAIESLVEEDDQVVVTTGSGSAKERFARVLVAIGRQANTEGLGLERTAVRLTERGFIEVDERQCTVDPRILAAGDVTGGIMLAHKATREGKVAAEVVAGEPSCFDARAMPAVVYTDPQIAWCGLTEDQAARQGIACQTQRFPWKYSGRAQTMGATDGFTKIIADPESGRILGLGACGRGAESLVAEGVLAIEMGALAEDLALSIHPHPSLSETGGEAAELFFGSATHFMASRPASGRRSQQRD